MNRRNFLAGLGALVGGLAIAEAIPLGRVWSFPSKIVPKSPFDYTDNLNRSLVHSGESFRTIFAEGDLISFAGGCPGFPENQIFQLRNGTLYPSHTERNPVLISAGA